MPRLTFSAPATRDIWPIIMMRIVCLFFRPFTMGLFNSSAQQQQRAQMMLQLEVELQATTELYSKCAPRRLTAVLPQSGLPARPTAAGRVLTRRATYLRSASWLFWGWRRVSGWRSTATTSASIANTPKASSRYVRAHVPRCMVYAACTVDAVCYIHRACYMLHTPFMP